MTQDQYLLMCEQMGWDPNPDEMPPEVHELSYEAQQALRLFNALPDKVEGMNGVWLGKDYAGLGDIMRIYKIDDSEEVFDLLQVCVVEAATHYEQQRKARQAASKVKR
jgi:hypothetical protein